MRYCSTNSFEESSSFSKRESHEPVMVVKKVAEGKKLEDGKYKHTVDLPKTTFGMRADSIVREPKIQKLWEDNQAFVSYIEVFGQMAMSGPVNWSPSSPTALAEAELEHIRLYAIFKLVSTLPTSNGSFEEFPPNLCLSIWTTTPWTVPANAGKHSLTHYSILKIWQNESLNVGLFHDKGLGVSLPQCFYHVNSKEPVVNKATIDHIKWKAPYLCVITHGFVLDERGRKMSKSLGNLWNQLQSLKEGKTPSSFYKDFLVTFFVFWQGAPSYGADVLRLWVSSVDYTNDVLIGSQILQQMSEIYRKLIGIFSSICERGATIEPGSFAQFIFSYTRGCKKFHEKSCQTVLAAHLLSIVRVVAQILPEDVWQNLLRWPHSNENWHAMHVEELPEVNKVLETARTGKLIGSSLDAKIYLHSSDTDLSSKLHTMCSPSNDAEELHHIYITSQTTVWVGVSPAEGSKCERCWNYSTKVGFLLIIPPLWQIL
ncbi:hypothetical protein AQUCO_00300326v1 [Aquilegia coerulea]|uniref:Uncharacterized protein n=1 Tax=Aquilegia coerulea TaxID=218851 RepID=A0A2G5EY96_AQUCA|nr:hypothetical protein AQUCO_00300326v1 [Aquilegia coerulea]